jgi:hypothetical protein
MELDKPLKPQVIDQTDNLAEKLEATDLNVIAGELIGYYQKDENDCDDRHKKMKMFLGVVDNDPEFKRVAKLQNGAANHYSLMTDAVNEFQTTFINEFPFVDVVKAVPTDPAKSQQDIALELQSQSQDAQIAPERAQQMVRQAMQKDRATRHAMVTASQDAVDLLNYQFTEDMPNWAEDTQCMAKMLAAQGTAIRKYSFCPIEKIPIFKMIKATDFVVDKDARSIQGAKRLSECHAYEYEQIQPLIRSGYFIEYADYELREDDEDDYNIVEMCCRLDLDDDGYPEPYVVWFDKDKSQILRIEKNFKDVLRGEKKAIVIKQKERYCRYSFLPNPKSFFGLGLGDILEQSQDALSSLTNLMIDAGAKATLGGGFYAGDVNKAGPIRFAPGEYKPLRISGQALREGIVDMPVPEPNQTLFSVMQLLDGKASSLANLSQFNTENFTANTAPTTAMIMYDQSTKKLRAILKRVFMAFSKEVDHLVKANEEYLNVERYSFLLQKELSAEIFGNKQVDFVPNKDIEEIGNMKGMAKVQFLGGMLQDPFINPKRARQEMFREMGFDDPDYFVTDPPPPQQGEPDPLMMEQLKIAQQQVQLQGQKQQLDMQRDMQKLQLEMQKLQADTQNKQAETAIKAEKNEIDRIQSTNEARESIAIATNQLSQAAKNGADARRIAEEVKNIDVTTN